MDVCVENVFTGPAIEAINVIQATADEEKRRAALNRQCGSQDKEDPRYGGTGQETGAPCPGNTSITPILRSACGESLKLTRPRLKPLHWTTFTSILQAPSDCIRTTKARCGVCRRRYLAARA